MNDAHAPPIGGKILGDQATMAMLGRRFAAKQRAGHIEQPPLDISLYLSLGKQRTEGRLVDLPGHLLLLVSV